MSFLRNEEIDLEVDEKHVPDKPEAEIVKITESPVSEAGTSQPIQDEDDQYTSSSMSVSAQSGSDEGKDLSRRNHQRKSRPYIAGGSGTRFGIGLVCVTSSGDFEAIRGWSESVSEVSFTESLCLGIGLHEPLTETAS